jgi:phosphomannomutase
MDGEVIYTFSCTSRIAQLCEQYNLPYQVTKIGFKYICDLMQNKTSPFLVGGEESGGIAIQGHIPERDGIWVGLTIWEYMAKTGKSLDDLIQELYREVGEFAVERQDLHIDEELKQATMQRCKNEPFQEIGPYQVSQVEDLDGFKFHLGDQQWVMIRPSGTEPVLRVYAEAPSRQEALDILEATQNLITQGDKANA